MNSRLSPVLAMVVATLLLISASVGAQDTERTMRSTIIGNQEQPQTLFLTPWKAADGLDGLSNEFNTDLDVLFGLIEREPFVRELRYRDMVVTRSKAQGR